MRPLVAALLLAASLPGRAADQHQPTRAYALSPGTDGRLLDCTLKVGPRDRVAQDGDLVIPAGASVEAAFALRGSVIVRSGARVEKAVAAGGSVVVEGGAVVEKEAVALSGDVRVEPNGHVRGEAVSLGGQVKIAGGGRVDGDVTSLNLQLGGTNLARLILDQIGTQGPCRVEPEKDAAKR
ncbi:MAG TPA: polymer-forming cytoskeletal protein [Anaeromyxobacteraceae bacterium]|nr:polymer-forming cytoskeletal protein [Anaeromyxobacteraceae bacterium]